MKAALDAGVNFFDNAEVYAGGEAERVMGRALRKLGLKRDSFLVSTKIYWGGDGPNQRGLSRKHIVEGLTASLARFELDYVDLVYCHRPDRHTPIEETVRAMNHLIDTGRAFYWGTSEWSAEQIYVAYGLARRERLIPPLMEQPEYHMFNRNRVEVEYSRLYTEIGLGLTTWSPLASGLLTGKYQDGRAPIHSRAAVDGMEWLRDRLIGPSVAQKLVTIARLQPVADELDCTLAQLAIAWCLKNPHVSSVITGASAAAQVTENMAALNVSARLTTEILARIDSILANKPAAPKDFRLST